jgi:hypothetical protein
VRSRRSAPLVAVALLLAACGGTDDDPETTAETEAQPDEDAGAAPELGDLPDPNEQVTDGAFRGDGVILPIPDGWELDPMAYAEGVVVASSEDLVHQIAAQSADMAELGEPANDFDSIVDANREQLPVEPEADEEIELAGAERAHLLRFGALTSGAEGEPEIDLLILIAEDGDGTLALFQYAAPTGEYQDDIEQLLLTEGGIDPDSEPRPVPQPPVEGEFEDDLGDDAGSGDGTGGQPGDDELGDDPDDES